MNLLTHIAKVLVAAFQPNNHAYTTVVYPVQGKAVVLHDGLGIRHERPWYQLSESLHRQGSCRTLFDTMQSDNATWDDPSMNVHAAHGTEVMDTTGVNPANGLPMMDGGIDVMGNPFGTDMLSYSWSLDCGLNGFGCSFSDFDFG